MSQSSSTSSPHWFIFQKKLVLHLFRENNPIPPKKTRHLQAFSRHLAQFLLISFRATLRLFGARLHWCCFRPVEADQKTHNNHRKVRMEKNNMTGWWLNQPIWKILVKMGSSSPIFGVKIKNMKETTTQMNSFQVLESSLVSNDVKISRWNFKR